MKSEKLSIKIEKMTTNDVDEIFKIEEETYGPHHWSKDSFYSEVSNNIARYYVAKLETGEIIGYIGSWFIIEEAHITNVSVSPKYRRNSIGEALLYHLLKQCYTEMIKYLDNIEKHGNSLDAETWNEKKRNFWNTEPKTGRNSKEVKTVKVKLDGYKKALKQIREIKREIKQLNKATKEFVELKEKLF